uniref:Ubiquitin carboxyl-terminal hydrolase n=2 Tax=Steinernema glaseri TaxID=37863 RepID=A0A1I7Y3I4_9BILA
MTQTKHSERVIAPRGQDDVVTELSNCAGTKPIGPFKLRTFHERNGRKVTIVLQDENGPCFLLAVVNCLILKDDLHIGSNDRKAGQVTFVQLINLIGSYLIDQSEQKASLFGKCNVEAIVKNCLEHLENVNTGIDVDIKFDKITSFKNLEMPGFVELLGLNLFHGWVSDPEDQELYTLIKDKSYEECKLHSLSCTNKRLDDFLKNQLTFTGLHEINQTMNDGETAVLFNNNHFSTIVKHKDRIYQLATDVSFLHAHNVDFVYEALVNTDGDTYYVDANFCTNKELTMSPLLWSHCTDSSAAHLSQNPQEGGTINEMRSSACHPSVQSQTRGTFPQHVAPTRDLPDITMQFPTSSDQSRPRSEHSKVEHIQGGPESSRYSTLSVVFL